MKNLEVIARARRALAPRLFRRMAPPVMVAAVLTACAPTGPTPEEARTLAKAAWIYGFPMAVNYKTMYEYSVDTSSPEYRGPFNTLQCAARLYSPEDRAVVTPNSDTPYCMGWLDLRAEPVVLSVPEMDEGRYYSFQLIDGYTHNFAYVGSLTTGMDAGVYLLTGPGWEGPAPEGFDDVFAAETDFVLAIGRTQLFGADDLGRVAEIQRNYGGQPLSAYRGTEPPAPAPAIDFPTWEVGAELTAASLEYLDFMLDFVGPAPEDAAVRERISLLGLGTPAAFDVDDLTPEFREAVEAGVQDARAELAAWIEPTQGDPLSSTRMFGTRDFLTRTARDAFGLETPYLPRAAGALLGLYGNSAAEAMYPLYVTDVEGRPLDASTSRYELRFPPDGLPPARAFWSLTMYDGQTQLLIDNEIDRYVINSAMLDDLPREPDGSLLLLIQSDPPPPARRVQWLPAPEGPFYAVLRLYGPEQEALTGAWSPPQLTPYPRTSR
jgi:hypothetical protein